MIDLIYPMGTVLFSWLLLFLLFSGLGSAVLKSLGQRLDSGWHILDSFWLGWALALGALQIWHFVFPVGDEVLLIFCIVAAILLFRQRQDGWAVVKKLRRNRPFLLVFALLSLWMSNRALGMPIAFDTGFRDIQAVTWIDTYPIVPGLGNLFSSLAFNHSVYLFDALLDAATWSRRSFYIARGLLLMVYLAYALGSALHFLGSRDEREVRWSAICATLTVPFILFYTVRLGGITNFLTDTVVDLLGLLTLMYLLDFLQYWKPNGDSKNYLIFRLAIIILTGFTVKQSFIVYGLATAVLVFVVWMRRGGIRTGKKNTARTILPIAILALALLVPWMARGVVTSGYLAFPQLFGRFEVDWVLPVEQIEGRQRTLAAMTRQMDGDRGAVLASWDWLGPWLQDYARNVFPTLLPTLISVVSLILYFLGHHMQEIRGQASNSVKWAVFPMMVMVVFWFFTVPDDKYVRYIFWGFAALSVTAAVMAWGGIPWRLRVLGVYAVFGLCMAYVAYLILRTETLFVPQGSNDGFHAHYLPVHVEFVTDSGLTINVPRGINQCWHIPIPCTPYPQSGLTERVKGEIGHGFRLTAKEDTDDD